MKRILSLCAAALVLTAAAALATGQTGPKPPQERREARNRRPTTLPVELADVQALSAVLGRPTDRSITLSILSAEAREAYVEYGRTSGAYTAKTDIRKLPASTAVEFVLEKLAPDTRYFHRLQQRKPGAAEFTAGQECTFLTQRRPGSTFTFEIQGDSHPERPQMFDPSLYALTLRAAAADRPDFYMTIGDDFSVDKLRTINADAVRQIYLNQRCFLSLVGRSAPLFLVNGNHEQAALCNLDGTPNSVAVLAQNARHAFFPQPAPDDFYTGDKDSVEHIGLLRDYCAWTWGDALFVVIDPYWHSKEPVDNVFGQRGKGQRDMWGITIGDEQYQWLKKTLQESTARYKFVFAHHVLGTGRGGIERAGLFEWGGKNNRDFDEFARKRPGWDRPIHPLMAKNRVTIFFQGHDHIFVRQQLDGVVYQTLPLPADPHYAFYSQDAYRTGDVFPGSGRVRVSVSPQKVRVEYVRSYLPRDATQEHPDGEVAFAYELPEPPKTESQP